MNHFFSPWVLLLLLAVPVLLAWRFVRMPFLPSPSGKGAGGEGGGRPLATSPHPNPLPRGEGTRCRLLRHPPSAVRPSVCRRPDRPGRRTADGGNLLEPRGGRKGGRVMVVERHSQWEPTTKPYDTTWFVEPEMFPDVNSGYNYAPIYRYLGQYYEMSRLLDKDKIDDQTLAKCDVLVLRLPRALQPGRGGRGRCGSSSRAADCC